ncbi:reverse transcriptase, putative [Ixodes scapularis]|uniref:Reverse transcriptase, putative n=1 Tax=Ixodes scapularis TaxID=6945 RepID=B7PS21_IXOSC|nr:reverse transcriptase, putative [Ixodes scapularis]|eukprot:XP_002401775.1 reverse transcriptase, putative [Ixodes scapularis]
MDPVLQHRGALQSSPMPQSQLDFVAQGARPRRPLRSCRRDRLQPSVEVELRKLLTRAPPAVFQGLRLWDLAQRALLGVNIFPSLNDYLREVFVDPAAHHRGQRCPRRQPARESRRKKKKREYAATQERFAKRQADCARAILDGPCESAITDCRGLLLEWRSFMTGSPPAPPPEPVSLPPQRIDVFQPVTAQDIKVALPPKNSAAGPDGFTARLLRSVPSLLLRVLMNLLLLLHRLPTAWRAARTSFIPKKNPAALPSDFRPITVGPVLQRLFHKILAKRVMAAAPLDFRQRAFQPVDGCAENILLLSTVLDEARCRLRPLHLASVDLAKAFDRVTTEAILRGALRAGFDDAFLAYLRELYATSYTTLQYGGEELVVQPTTGVRQGDPLSPVLFNMVLDEFLSSVDPRVAFRSGDLTVDAMAFADDLVVCASTPQGLQQRLNDLAAFLSPRGLNIDVAKSFTLSLQPSAREKKCKIVTTNRFHINGEPLPVSGVASVWRGTPAPAPGHFSSKETQRNTTGN